MKLAITNSLTANNWTLFACKGIFLQCLLDCFRLIQLIIARVLDGGANVFVIEPNDDKIIGWVFLINRVLTSMQLRLVWWFASLKS